MMNAKFCTVELQFRKATELRRFGKIYCDFL